VDVAQYVARINQWAEAERQASATISQLFRSHFLDADRVTSLTDRMLPVIEKHLATITRYTPETPEVSGIHARYVGAWRRLEEGFDLIRRGMISEDGIRLAKGRRHLEQWSEDMLRVASDLRELVTTTGIRKADPATEGVSLWKEGSPRASSTGQRPPQ
jgi:hypothetical protein